MNEIASNVIIAIGILFNLFGCLGLIRLPDVYNRLQAATKCATLGTCGILFGLLVRYGFSDIGIKSAIALPILFLTSTVAAHALIRGAYRFGIRLWPGSVIDDYEKTAASDHEVSENKGD
jgi:multicomponent Na+:H+ antiporter subunit G